MNKINLNGLIAFGFLALAMMMLLSGCTHAVKDNCELTPLPVGYETWSIGEKRELIKEKEIEVLTKQLIGCEYHLK